MFCVVVVRPAPRGPINIGGLAFTAFPVFAVVTLLVVLLQDSSLQPGVASLSLVLSCFHAVMKGGQ